jgi:hypothetical protein
MILFITRDGKRRTIVSSKTPSLREYPYLNRNSRRGLIYSHPTARLLIKIKALRKEMYKTDIKVPPMPKFKNRKVLSGHMGRLKELIRE